MMLRFLKWFGDRMYLFVLTGQRIQDHIRKHSYGWDRKIQERITTRGLILDDNLRKKVTPFPDHPIQQLLYDCDYNTSKWDDKNKGIGQLLHGFILQVEKESEAIWLKMGSDKILSQLKIAEIYQFENFSYLEKQNTKLKQTEQQLFLLNRLVGMQEDAERINKEAEGVYIGLLNPQIKEAIFNVSKAEFDRQPLYRERTKIRQRIKQHLKRRLIKTYE